MNVVGRYLYEEDNHIKGTQQDHNFKPSYVYYCYITGLKYSIDSIILSVICNGWI